MPLLFSDTPPIEPTDLNKVQAQPKRGLIRRGLEPALKLWLRSQVKSVTTLQVHLEGGDRQILSGYLPHVTLEADHAVYQGLHFSHLKMNGHNLRINIGQVLKGKALQLLEPLPVEVDVWLSLTDVQASLNAALLQGVILKALQMLVGEQITEALGTSLQDNLALKDPDVQLTENRIRLSTQLRHSNGRSVPVGLQTGLTLSNPSTLALHQPEWLPTPQSRRGLPLHDLDGYCFDLGSHVQLQEVSITAEGLRITGQLTIMSAEHEER
jgi:hypothetical protein